MATCLSAVALLLPASCSASIIGVYPMDSLGDASAVEHQVLFPGLDATAFRERRSGGNPASASEINQILPELGMVPLLGKRSDGAEVKNVSDSGFTSRKHDFSIRMMTKQHDYFFPRRT